MRERKCMAGKGRCKGRQEEVKEIKLEEKMGKMSLKREEGQRIRWVQRESKGGERVEEKQEGDK